MDRNESEQELLNSVADEFSGTETEREEVNVRRKCKKKVLILDANNIGNFSIYDVVLPLPGYDVTYPTNETGNWYVELLQADGLADSGFKQSVK